MPRMMAWSTQRPKKPASRPQNEPASAASAVAARPTTREIRAPWSNRLKRSRPNSSVPSQWPGVKGRASRRVVSMASGSCGASAGATTAAIATRTTRQSPSSAPPLLPNARATSLIADPRVEDRVEEIHDEIHQHERRGDQQHAALDQRVVTRLDRSHHHRSEAGPGKYRLGEN